MNVEQQIRAVRAANKVAEDAMQQGRHPFGAGAHTDYGMMTLLFQDAVGGLEVQAKRGNWQPVPANPELTIINCGDLLERWTNGRFRSTNHRVLPNLGVRARQSIVLFIGPDPEVEVACLASCCDAKNRAQYATIRAGEFIQQKILATHT